MLVDPPVPQASGGGPHQAFRRGISGDGGICLLKIDCYVST